MNSDIFPVIEIHGTGVHNRGAELMAIAISEKLREVYPNVKIVVPSTFGQQADIKKYNFTTTFSFESRRKKHIYSLLMAILSKNTINPKAVNVVLDASGFAFSDQWGHKPALKLFKKMSSITRKKQLLILLPQALGSFNKQEVQSSIKVLFDRAEVVFPRDQQSLEYSLQILNDDSKIKKSPDFTIDIKPLKKDTLTLPKNFVAIVPNYRMLDKSKDANEYLMFLKKGIDTIQQKNLNPVFIIHDGSEDLKVVEMLGKNYENIEVIQDDDPRVLKWILGHAQFVIGSRFHALVSTMSQGIPCIGVGWSHKYPELFTDFNNREGLIENLSDFKELERQIIMLADLEERQEKSTRIISAAKKLKEQNALMWQKVILEIDKIFIK